MAELHLATGFLPRVDRRNHRGVESAVAMARSHSLFGNRLHVPWLIVEGPWASGRPPLLAHRQELGDDVERPAPFEIRVRAPQPQPSRLFAHHAAELVHDRVEFEEAFFAVATRG